MEKLKVLLLDMDENNPAVKVIIDRYDTTFDTIENMGNTKKYISVVVNYGACYGNERLLEKLKKFSSKIFSIPSVFGYNDDWDDKEYYLYALQNGMDYVFSKVDTELNPDCIADLIDIFYEYGYKKNNLF